MKKVLVAICAVMLFGSVTAKADVQTLPDYSGPASYNDPGPYQPPTVIGTFNIMSGDTSVVFSGTFGNVANSNGTAGMDLYLGTVLVATCIEFAPCWDGPVTPFSDSLTAAQISALGTGIVDLTAIETSEYTLQLGSLTLTQSALAPTPEPSSIVLLGTGLLATASSLRRRFKK